MTSRKGSKYVSGSTDAQSACVTRILANLSSLNAAGMSTGVWKMSCGNQWLSHLTAFHGEGQAGDCICCQHPAGG